MTDTTIVIEPCNSGNYATERPTLRAEGPDDNIYMDYITKGAGAHVWRGWDGGAHAFVAYAQSIDSQNFLEAHGTVGPPELRATGPGEGDLHLLLRPQNNGLVQVRNGMELVLIDSDGAKVTAGFMSTHKGIFGGSSTDPTFRAEPGHAFRFFVGGSETAQFTPDLALGLFPVAEPAAASDMGKLYIDIADGDLKIKFANGTVKTIATN